jgi:hypothetical protein
MIRSPGLAGDPPGWFGRDHDVPRAVHAGPWIAQHGQFFDGWGRRADLGDLPALADEIRALAAAGVRPHDALAAGSWAARAYLGLPGLAEGAPADAVVYDADPRTDLGRLDHPRAVILRGRRA